MGNKNIVSEDLVGVDDRAEAIIKMLDLRSSSVQFLGIHGMGGIDKTTLANVIFNSLSSHFKDCYFLQDVRELSQHHGLVYLQKQLLSNFHLNLNKIHHVDEGIDKIKRVFGNKKVLIVLDDVDEKEQLKCLAKEGDWFGSGSRIIITTRDQRVLRIVGEAIGEGHVKKSTKVLTYEVCELEFQDALKLFSKHAFRRDSPPDHFGSLSNEIVSTLGMLPLALEVTGSSLNNEPKEFWQATLKKLKDAPPDEVQSKLMISYDKLDNKKKSKEIVRQENKDPNKRSRVWNCEEVWNILKQKEVDRKDARPIEIEEAKRASSRNMSEAKKHGRSLESLVDTSNLNLECCLIVRCKRLLDRRNYCKRGWGCYCEMLFEGLWKSDPMEVQQVLQGHSDVALAFSWTNIGDEA
ncbi:disease resistance protein RUN1-like [Eucalyptus grandis]|uniref:disease resistance protein RUN1-like n=1 Tax=Eucalyptus grandis TaxID=71139 RepID=UPI00192E8534|nr:disease resistance protein RUN1-like [Eucalyptus grandis]